MAARRKKRAPRPGRAQQEEEGAAALKTRVRADAERVKREALAGVHGLLMKLNLAPQSLALRVYPDREIPVTVIDSPWGPTVTPPAEAYHVGRILEQMLPTDRLSFLLKQASDANEGLHGVRLSPRAFGPGHAYFRGLAREQALGVGPEVGARGPWAAVALGSASLVRWSGSVDDALGDPLRDERWRARFGDAIAAFVEDLVDGAVPPGSRDLASIMRRLAARDRRSTESAPGRRGPKRKDTSHHALVRGALEQDSGHRMYYDEIAQIVSLTVEQVRKALQRVEGVVLGGDAGKQWAMLPKGA